MSLLRQSDVQVYQDAMIAAGVDRDEARRIAYAENRPCSLIDRRCQCCGRRVVEITATGGSKVLLGIGWSCDICIRES